MNELAKGVGAGAFTRRHLLERLAAMGGSAMLLAGMDALGFGIGSAMAAPPKLEGKPKKNKVLVLGAGNAGLAAAYELTQAGYQVTVVEARSFAGGRAQTARKGFRLTELGGTEQVCDYDEGLYLNHGPWRIPYHHHSTLHYTKKFGVQLELFNNDNDASFIYFEKGKGPLAGKPIRKREIVADTLGYSSEILAKLSRQNALNTQLSDADREQLIEFLVHFGALDKKDLNYKGVAGRGFVVDPGAGTNPGPGTPTTPYKFADVLNSGLWHMVQGISEWDQQRTMFQPYNGMEQIPKAIAKNLPDGMIKFSTEVQQIRQTPKGVTAMVNGPAGAETLTADWMICTIPLSVLKEIDNGLSQPFKDAMAKCAYAPVGKIGLQMKRRFWEEDHSIYGGHVFCDNPDINNIALPSTGWQSQKGVLLGYYNFGPNAAKVSAKSPADRATMAVDYGQKVFPAYKDSYETSFSVAWHRVKYNLGGWGMWSDEARATAYPVLTEPDGRIYLAGEHLSYIGGWQAGAFESAWQQVERLHARAMKG
ncbi:flavin monoamine oxidase family protein [Sphingomonas montanisoli]|uniref:Tryptophan 2-monooxygenase n=1 Tax=Sphingomonas montanisoli TaxID=2606412 RepID=A0A5D9CB65_9SPHN|nr:flavin monoamine oxidase family protein [Sphingomonas montanisoli]TZG27361.1 flavin monoamine oxidase family protein [Sphingomonas montanisoli]